MRSFIYIGRLKECETIVINQAFFGKYIRRIYLGKESVVDLGDRLLLNMPKFGFYIIKTYGINGELLYVNSAVLVKEVGFS